MTQDFQYDVFLCHSSGDKAIVRDLAVRLKSDGLRVWFDEWEIGPGDIIGLKVEQGLEKSRTLILCMSENAFASDWVKLERHTAVFRDPVNEQRRFIPLRLDDAKIKDMLRQFAYVDWRTKSAEQYARLLKVCTPPRAEAEIDAVCLSGPNLRGDTGPNAIAHVQETGPKTRREQEIQPKTGERRSPYAVAEWGRASHQQDSRPGVGLRPDGLPDIEWCDVPAPPDGIFIMGADDQSDNPRREVELNYSFKIAKYLITYRQFQAFVDSDEYKDPAWWRGFPANYRPQAMAEQNNRYLNHPRDNVSWYQAVAFTRWLDHKHRQAGLIPPLPKAAAGGGPGVQAKIRLPTEQEWEYAARGTDERKYPYPGDFDAAKGNTRETGIGQTSAVGLFPDGAAACGALDMAGNLWEWCLNDYEKPEVLDGYRNGKSKVLRGGSFVYGQGYAACAYSLLLLLPVRRLGLLRLAGCVVGPYRRTLISGPPDSASLALQANGVSGL